MRIHYISNHSILEYDEVSLLTELGHTVFSNGAYTDPRGAHTLPRPGIPGAQYHQKYEKLAKEYPRTEMPKELIDAFDVTIVMHNPKIISTNWENFRGKKVV